MVFKPTKNLFIFYHFPVFVFIFFSLKFVVSFPPEFCPLSLSYFSVVFSSSLAFFPSHNLFFCFFLPGRGLLPNTTLFSLSPLTLTLKCIFNGISPIHLNITLQNVYFQWTSLSQFYSSRPHPPTNRP